MRDVCSENFSDVTMRVITWDSMEQPALLILVRVRVSL